MARGVTTVEEWITRVGSAKTSQMSPTMSSVPNAGVLATLLGIVLENSLEQDKVREEARMQWTKSTCRSWLNWVRDPRPHHQARVTTTIRKVAGRTCPREVALVCSEAEADLLGLSWALDLQVPRVDLLPHLASMVEEIQAAAGTAGPHPLLGLEVASQAKATGEEDPEGETGTIHPHQGTAGPQDLRQDQAPTTYRPHSWGDPLPHHPQGAVVEEASQISGKEDGPQVGEQVHLHQYHHLRGRMHRRLLQACPHTGPLLQGGNPHLEEALRQVETHLRTASCPT